MRWVRSILGIIVGYTLFAIAAVALFVTFDLQPHEPAAFWFMAVATLYGMAFAFIGGWLSQWISGRVHQLPSAFVSILIIAGAVSEMFTVPDGGSVWSQVAAIFFMAPAATVGGWVFLKRVDYMAPPE